MGIPRSHTPESGEERASTGQNLPSPGSQWVPSRCPWPLQMGSVQQLSKVNKVRFSNPTRLLKPLLICLSFCFICSAQVKGNLTFGILTANNPTPRMGPGVPQCQHVAHQGGENTSAICRGSQKAQVRSGSLATCKGTTQNCQLPQGQSCT